MSVQQCQSNQVRVHDRHDCSERKNPSSPEGDDEEWDRSLQPLYAVTGDPLAGDPASTYSDPSLTPHLSYLPPSSSTFTFLTDLNLPPCPFLPYPCLSYPYLPYNYLPYSFVPLLFFSGLGGWETEESFQVDDGKCGSPRPDQGRKGTACRCGPSG